MQCPKCGLLNPETAERCDCGWDFVRGAMMKPYAKPDSPLLSNLASLDDRFLGQFADGSIAFGVILIALIPSAGSESLGGFTFAVGAVIAAAYIIFSDGLKNGQSYGKRLVKTAVVDADTGEPCTFGQSLVRNLLLAILGIVDWVFIFGSRRQRLGDKAANTLVIKSDRAGHVDL